MDTKIVDDRYIWIYGKHAVLEALSFRPDVVSEVFLRDTVQPEVKSKLLAGIKKVTIFQGDAIPRDVDRHAVHQGFIAKIDRQKLVIDFENS